jgi:phosphohistidine phosphatase SixA
MKRRDFLVGSAGLCLGSGALASSPDASMASLARAGGVILIRHATTEAGLGDPPNFTLGQCSTQRNLSEAGREESRAIGAWFRKHQLKVQAVLSSQWCRCQDTARLAFGAYQDWPALNSTFAGQGQHEQQIQMLRERLRALPANTLEVWVTHQVIMTGLTGDYPAMGEGFLVDSQGKVKARGMMRSGT